MPGYHAELNYLVIYIDTSTTWNALSKQIFGHSAPVEKAFCVKLRRGTGLYFACGKFIIAGLYF